MRVCDHTLVIQDEQGRQLQFVAFVVTVCEPGFLDGREQLLGLFRIPGAAQAVHICGRLDIQGLVEFHACIGNDIELQVDVPLAQVVLDVLRIRLHDHQDLGILGQEFIIAVVDEPGSVAAGRAADVAQDPDNCLACQVVTQVLAGGITGVKGEIRHCFADLDSCHGFILNFLIPLYGNHCSYSSSLPSFRIIW